MEVQKEIRETYGQHLIFFSHLKCQPSDICCPSQCDSPDCPAKGLQGASGALLKYREFLEESSFFAPGPSLPQLPWEVIHGFLAKSAWLWDWQDDLLSRFFGFTGHLTSGALCFTWPRTLRVSLLLSLKAPQKTQSTNKGKLGNNPHVKRIPRKPIRRRRMYP